MPERVSILIDSKEFRTWESVEISLALDSFSTASFTAPFDPARKDLRDAFRPFSFKPLAVEVGGKRLFTGTLVGVNPSFDANQGRVEVTGYALPGVLNDCPPPGSSVPHEYKGLTLRQIAERLADPFGLRIVSRAPIGAKFDKAKIEVGQRNFEFLAELARQRNQVLSNTDDGAILFWQSVDVGDPVAVLVEGEAPVSKVEARFSPQDYFSEVTGFAPTKRGRRGAKHTEPNPWLSSVFRPLSFTVDDTEKADTPEATRAHLGRMFGNIACWTIDDLPTWRDSSGNLWRPNTTLKLTAPRAMIYRRSELLIRTVSLRQDANKESARLDLALPGAFNGKTPSFIPWKEPI